MTKKELKLPKSLDDIKVKDYQKYLVLLEQNKGAESSDFLNLKTLNIFCDLDVKEAMKTPVSEFDYALQHLGVLFSEKTPLIRQFYLKDDKGDVLKLGFIPDLHKMSYGEYLDAEKYAGDFNQIHKLMAVMYRPVVFDGKLDTYLIDEYRGTEHLSDIMLEAPVSVALGMQVFFWNLEIRLSKLMMDSILRQGKEMQEESQQLSEESGELSSQLSSLQTETLEELMRLRLFHYTSA
jgi:hypothetical protein